MSETNGSPSGHHFVQLGKSRYDFHLDHWKVHIAEELLGCGILDWTGGGVTYSLALGYAMLEGQHGITNRKDVAQLYDLGDSDEIDIALMSAVVDFFQPYPHTHERLAPLRAAIALRKERREKAGKAEQKPTRKTAKAAD